MSSEADTSDKEPNAQVAEPFRSILNGFAMLSLI